ncbi:hypothetical protein Pfo_026014 [Paulownia fortunei]|nr:hypothetical protein Pfo_026014 [Paulownia fortunei]
MSLALSRSKRSSCAFVPQEKVCTIISKNDLVHHRSLPSQENLTSYAPPRKSLALLHSQEKLTCLYAQKKVCAIVYEEELVRHLTLAPQEKLAAYVPQKEVLRRRTPTGGLHYYLPGEAHAPSHPKRS